MAMTTARRKTTERGLGWRHQQARNALLRKHTDGAPCAWDGRPMYRDRTKNWDYNPNSNNPNSGALQADHSTITRAEAIRRGVPIPLPDRLLHGECNRQRGDGSNDHLAWINSGRPPVMDSSSETAQLQMAWPW
jgi:hypothetical protein